MPDMFCSLIELPPLEPLLKPLRDEGITLRRANPWEKSDVCDWVLRQFSSAWRDEVSVTFARQPVTCYLAVRDKEILGFVAYEATRRNYFGPTGVSEAARGKGIGAALCIAALQGLRELGYTYAVIGGAGPTGFYSKLVGAIPVPFHEGKGIYHLVEDPTFTPRNTG